MFKAVIYKFLLLEKYQYCSNDKHILSYECMRGSITKKMFHKVIKFYHLKIKLSPRFAAELSSRFTFIYRFFCTNLLLGVADYYTKDFQNYQQVKITPNKQSLIAS